jgi:hypothetical protein
VEEATSVLTMVWGIFGGRSLTSTELWRPVRTEVPGPVLYKLRPQWGRKLIQY